jgi:hypothetical protein
MDEIKTGDAVTFVDEYGKDRPALVTAVWSQSCVNVVFVSADPNRTDSCGRQTEHRTSVGYRADWMAHGNYFVKVGDAVRNPVKAPQSV